MTGNHIIEIKNLRKIYIMGDTQVNALQSVTLDIAKNEYVALMGPSGSGKSTLMNLIGCLDSPTSGDYFLNSKQVSAMPDNELAQVRNKEIGFCIPDL
jgi:putative ABC transport system ATP-binding protein